LRAGLDEPANLIPGDFHSPHLLPSSQGEGQR